MNGLCRSSPSGTTTSQPLDGGQSSLMPHTYRSWVGTKTISLVSRIIGHNHPIGPRHSPNSPIGKVHGEDIRLQGLGQPCTWSHGILPYHNRGGLTPSLWLMYKGICKPGQSFLKDLHEGGTRLGVPSQFSAPYPLV